MRTYKIGVIGFGFIGKVHAYAYQNLPFYYDNLPFKTKITHVCCAHPESARKAAELVGADHSTTDFRELTENPDIDIVNICSPNNRHLEQLLSALAHGKHIYCDKPLVTSMAEAEQVLAAAKSYQGTFQATFQLRFFPSSLRAKQLVDAGFLGKVLEFRSSFLHAGSADPSVPLKWKLSAQAGGGVIADLASHAIDMVTWLLGPLDKLTATTDIAYPERPDADHPGQTLPVDAEDRAAMLCRTKSGASGVIEATKLATGSEDELRVEIHGAKGAIRFNSMDPHHLEIYDATAPGGPLGGLRGWTAVDTGQRYGSPANFPAPKSSVGWLRSHVACLHNFMRAVEEGRDGDPGLEQCVQVQRTMEAARRSAASGAWVEV